MSVNLQESKLATEQLSRQHMYFAGKKTSGLRCCHQPSCNKLLLYHSWVRSRMAGVTRYLPRQLSAGVAENFGNQTDFRSYILIFFFFHCCSRPRSPRID
jgi:hypothetical protein